MTAAQEFALEHDAGMHADTVVGCPRCAEDLFELLDGSYVDFTERGE